MSSSPDGSSSRPPGEAPPSTSSPGTPAPAASDEGGSFAEHPLSVMEARANKSHDAGDWTPRDALIATLRDIDSGKIKPHTLIIGWAEPGESASAVAFGHAAAGATLVHTLGVAAFITHRMLEVRHDV